MTSPIASRTFRENLQAMGKRLRLNWRQVADECGFDDAGYKWLRRAASTKGGVSRRQRNNRDRLDALIKLLCDRFPQLKKTIPADERKQIFWNPKLGELFRPAFYGTQVGNPETTRMFEQLLQTGEFNYLRDLVNDLHRQYPWNLRPSAEIQDE